LRVSPETCSLRSTKLHGEVNLTISIIRSLRSTTTLQASLKRHSLSNSTHQRVLLISSQSSKTSKLERPSRSSLMRNTMMFSEDISSSFRRCKTSSRMVRVALQSLRTCLPRLVLLHGLDQSWVESKLPFKSSKINQIN
jgi:hypothetical protein